MIFKEIANMEGVGVICHYYQICPQINMSKMHGVWF
jgi:hypothetical protein